MKRTGEILKKAREKKGLSINEIALSLKISSKVLKAIEEGDTDQLPAKTFLRGFVQSYANYLRLDVNTVLNLFHEEMGTTKPSPIIQMPEQDATLDETERKSGDAASPRATTSSSSEKTFSGLSKNNNSRTITFTILGAVLVGLIVFTKKMIDKYQKEGVVSEVEITTPLEGTADATSAAVSASPSPMSTAMSTPFATPTPTQNSTPLSTPTPTHSVSPTPGLTPKPSVTPSPSITPSPTVKPSATPTPSPSASPSPSPSASPSPSPSPSASPSPTPSNKPVEVIVEALDRVEIDFALSAGKFEKIILNAEQVHTFKSKTGLRLNISNGGAVNVIVNGKDLGIPGNLGKPVKLNF